MADTVSRVRVFLVQPKRYTLAGIFSLTLHGMLALGALAWARQSVWLDPLRGPLRSPRPYPLRYVVLLPLPPAPAVAPLDAEPISARRPDPAPQPGVALAQLEPMMTGAIAATLPEASAGASEPTIRTEEIAPGEVASIAGAGSTPINYARVDQRDRIRVGDIDPEGPDGKPSVAYGDRLGTTHVAELVGPAADACPALRRADSEPPRPVIVSIGFDVDVRGAVDPGSLHVVQSPDRPQTEHRLYGHMYAVAIGAKVDRALPDAEPVYDSVVTREVRQHVAALHFRPALRDGRPIRSSVLVSCQSS